MCTKLAIFPIPSRNWLGRLSKISVMHAYRVIDRTRSLLTSLLKDRDTGEEICPRLGRCFVVYKLDCNYPASKILEDVLRIQRHVWLVHQYLLKYCTVYEACCCASTLTSTTLRQCQRNHSENNIILLRLSTTQPYFYALVIDGPLSHVSHPRLSRSGATSHIPDPRHRWPRQPQ